MGRDPPNLLHDLAIALISYRDSATLPVYIEAQISPTGVRVAGDSRVMGCVRPRLNKHFDGRRERPAAATVTIASKEADERQQQPRVSLHRKTSTKFSDSPLKMKKTSSLYVSACRKVAKSA